MPGHGRSRTPPPRGTGTLAFAFGVCQADELPTPVLVELLGRLDVSAAAARQLITRLQAHGWLHSRRAGRVSVVWMSGQLRAEFEQVRGGGGDAAETFDGAFHLVAYDLPERERALRDQLRATAFAAGFAGWRPGMLIGCRPPVWLDALLPRLRAAGDVETGTWLMDLATARRVASRAWNLPARSVELQAAAARVRQGPAVTGDDDTWHALRRLHHALTTAIPVLLDLPALPSDLFGPDWPQSQLSAAVAEASQTFGEPAAATVAGYLRAHPLAELVRSHAD